MALPRWLGGKVREESFTLRDPNARFIVDWLKGGFATPVGKDVSPDSAITGTIAVYSCVGLITDAISTMPMLLYKDGPDGTRQRVADAEDPLARMLHRFPNPELTAQEFYEALLGHCTLWGNGYAYIVRDGGGRAVELWPLRPDAMHVLLINDAGETFDPSHVDPRGANLRRTYVYDMPNGELMGIPRENVLHIRALATNGYVGLSPIATARVAIALEQAGAEHGARLFSNSAMPGGLLTFPQVPGGKNLTGEEKDKIRDEWNKKFRGLSNAHRMAILEGGVTWQAIGMPNDDAQWIESRKFQIGEIARLYRIPPHLIQDVDRSTSWGTGIEQQNIGFLTYTLRPWLVRAEQAINRDLGFGRGGRALTDLGLTPEFLVEGLLRGDTKSRMEAYGLAISNSIMSPADASRKENLPPLDGADRPLLSVNLVPAELAGVPNPTQTSVRTIRRTAEGYEVTEE